MFEQFVSVPPPPPRAGDPGVYLLLDGGRVVYVGSSGDVPVRVGAHFDQARARQDKRFCKQFDDALWLSLPYKVLPHYEGALIRGLRPRYNLVAPAGGKHDREILDGLDLGHLTTAGWREHMYAVRLQARKQAA